MSCNRPAAGPPRDLEVCKPTARKSGVISLVMRPARCHDSCHYVYSSCRRHHSYGGDCGQPAGESSQVSCRPSGVRSKNA